MLRRAARTVSRVSVLLALGIGCGNGRAAPGASASASPALAPVSEPARVGGTLVIGDSGATWERFRAALGGDKSLLPSRFGTFVASAVGLPVACAELVSDHEPVVGAVLEPTLLAPFEAAIAVHLRSADGVLTAATQGQSPAFRAERDAASKGDVLTRVASGPKVALGIFGNHLVVGTSVDAITALGPWLARTLSAARDSPADADAVLDLRGGLLDVALPIAALKASLPDGPAASVLNPLLKELFERARGATGARVALRASATHTTLVATIERPASATSGARAPTEGLFGMPAGVHLAVLDAHATTSALGSPFASFGDYLAPTERADAERAGAALASARGRTSLVGLENGPVGPAIYARSPWSDAPGGRDALDALVAIADRDAAKDALAAHGVQLLAKRTVLENVGGVVRFRVGPYVAPAKKGSPATAPTASVDVLFRDGAASLEIASGAEAQSALLTLVNGARLDADADLRALAGATPKEADLALFLDLARLSRGPRADRSRAIVVETDEPTRLTLTGAFDVEALRTILRVLTE